MNEGVFTWKVSVYCPFAENILMQNRSET